MEINNKNLIQVIDKAYQECGTNAYFTNGFKKGCDFGVCEAKKYLKQIVDKYETELKNIRANTNNDYYLIPKVQLIDLILVDLNKFIEE